VLKNKWALVVEEDAHSLIAISSILRDLGIHFKRNTTGANVSEQMRAMNPPPDFIFLDLDLSSGDAFAINRQLHSERTDVAVIAFSSGQDFALRQRAQNEGFAAFVHKPLPRRQFGDLLLRILAGERVWEAAG